MALVSTQPLAKMSTRNIPGGKGGRCVPNVMNVMKIWDPKPPGTFWATPGLLGTPLPFTLRTGLWSFLKEVGHNVRFVYLSLVCDFLKLQLFRNSFCFLLQAGESN